MGFAQTPTLVEQVAPVVSSYMAPATATTYAARTAAAPAVTYTAGAAPAGGVQYVTFQGKQLPHFHETHLQTQHPILLREHANLLYSTIGHATLGRAVPIHDHELIEFILWCQEMHLTPLLLIGGLSA